MDDVFLQPTANVDALLQQINTDLKEQSLRNRIEMVEMGYVSLSEAYFVSLRERAQLHPDGQFLRPTPLIEKAIRKASELHTGQKRKCSGTSLDYLSHPLSVCEILARHTDDEEALVAAILHDTVEDTSYTFEKLGEDFGKAIAELVQAVSEDDCFPSDRKTTWEKRKKSYLKNLQTGPDKALLVSAADKIHNLATMRESYILHQDKIWDFFNAPADKRLWFYEEVLKVISGRLKHPLVDEFAHELQLCQAAF
jgi:(p)ppGpp synthase/HD superfamily hydrolase